MRLRELTENQSAKKQILQNYESLSTAEKAAFQELVGTRASDFKKGETRTLGDEEFEWLGAQWASKKTGKIATKQQRLQLSTEQTVTNRVAELYNTAKDQDLVIPLARQFKLQRAGRSAERAGDWAGDVAADLAGSLRKATGGVAPAGQQKQQDDELDDIVKRLGQKGYNLEKR